jgi:hypothetical protein
MRMTNNKKKRDRRRSAGMCTECGTNKPMEGYTKCSGCHEKIEAVRLARVQNRKDSNCCTRCGRSKAGILCWTNNYCAGCHLGEKFNWIGTKEEAEQIINNLLEKQDYRCAMTDRDLKTNKFHIDHIIPRSIVPSRLSDPTNWQLIVEDANMFKEGVSVETILSIARDMVKKAIKDGKMVIEDLR